MASLSSLVYCFWARPGAYPSGATFSFSPLGKALGLKKCFTSALIANIIPSWKGLQWTNTLAYYEYSSIMVEKSFMRSPPGRRSRGLFRVRWPTRWRRSSCTSAGRLRRRCSGHKVINLFTDVIYKRSLQASVLPGRPFQLLSGKDSSLPKSGAPQRCFTRISSGLTRKHYNTLEKVCRAQTP